MAGLAHQLGEAGARSPAAVAARRAGVAGVALGIEPGVQRGLLDQPGHRLVGQAWPVTLPVLVTAQNSGRSARTVGVAVQSRSAAVRRCSSQGSSAAAGQTPGSAGLAQTAMSWPAPCWSVFDRRTSSRRPRSGTGLHVAQGQRDELGAAQRGAEAEQQHGAVAGAERRWQGRGVRRASGAARRAPPGLPGGAAGRPWTA